MNAENAPPSPKRPRSRLGPPWPWLAYALAVALPPLLVGTYPLLGLSGSDQPLSLLLLPVLLCAYLGGLGPGLLATALAALLGDYLLLRPFYGFDLPSRLEAARLLVLVIVGGVGSFLSEELHRARLRADEGRQRYAVTLASIGDAVITTDAAGRVTFLNNEASRLTGWGDDAIGRPLDTIFRIISEESRAAVESPVTKVLRSGHVVGLANHTLLIHRDGRETPIDDSGAPIRSGEGAVLGVVLVFRDVTAQRRAELALRESESRFRQLAESLPQLVWTTTPDGQCDYLSPQWVAYTGIPEAEQLGYAWVEQLHPDDREPTNAAWSAAIARGEPVFIEFRVRRYDGVYRWFDTRALPLRDVSGKIVKWFGTNTDIADQKRISAELTRSERMLKLFVDLAPAAIAMFDTEMRYIAASRRFIADYRLPDENLIGRSHYEVFPEMPERWRQIHQRCLAGAIESNAEDPFPRGDGTLDWIRWELHPWYEDATRVGGLVLFSEVITERKRIEDELAAERAHLAERVAERTAELRLANAELARATRLKDEFLANMSHELRTPLTAILGRTELLQEAIYGPLNPRQNEALRGIDASGRHLLALINDILDLSKIEAGRIDIEPAPMMVEALCQASLQMVTQAARSRNLKVQTSYDRQVTKIYADERRLKQILVNLLTNAVKFTPEGGTIGLEVAGDHAAQTLSFTVWDTGIGIAADQIEQLFEPFVQIDHGLNRQYEGTGLGLALVQRLTAAHGGRVDVASTPGVGSRFRVTLPWQTTLVGPEGAVEPPAEPPAVEAPAPGGELILLAEDNEQNSQVIEEYLRAHGYTVVVAQNGFEALSRGDATPPALVLMDIQMPGIDGLETIRRMRANGRLAQVPIIALTALAMPGDRERCLAAGANEYLTKPVSLAALQKMIRGLLSAA